MLSILALALAGRRIDAPDATVRFPFTQVEVVRSRLRQLLADSGATTLVCSAACGADLVGLQAAQALGLRRRVILPFAAEAFRETSVVDRPGEWGPIFDELIAEARVAGDLVTMSGSPGDDAAYARANETILDEALLIGESARSRHLRVISVSTE